MMVTVAIWYEGRDIYNPLGERNAGGIEVAKESCYGSSKSVPACVRTVMPQEGAAGGRPQGQHCRPRVSPLPGLSGFFQKDECHQLKNESSFPKQLKTWQRWQTSVPIGINWIGGLIPFLLFPRGPE